MKIKGILIYRNFLLENVDAEVNIFSAKEACLTLLSNQEVVVTRKLFNFYSV